MVVTVEKIPDEGLTLKEPLRQELLAEVLSAGRGTGFRPVEGAVPEFSAQFQKVGSGVLLQGALRLVTQAPCKRCLAEVRVTVPVDFTLSLVPKVAPRTPDNEKDDDEAGAEAGSFGLDEADQEPFDGKTIDTDPIVREQVLLALPMHALCRDDCKGLCGMCGQNLNEATCGCDAKGIDPRLMALKNIKLN
jgi:uncharacterized protein